MTLVDYTKYVLRAVSSTPGIKQTELTVAVWGISGRGNKSLTNVLFPYCVRQGWIKMDTSGRGRAFSLLPAGRAFLDTCKFDN